MKSTPSYEPRHQLYDIPMPSRVPPPGLPVPVSRRQISAPAAFLAGVLLTVTFATVVFLVWAMEFYR